MFSFVIVGTLHGSSSGLLHVDGHPLPYAVNHTIIYNSTHSKRMPYLVQRLSIDGAVGQFDEVTGDVYYRLTASINKGANFNVSAWLTAHRHYYSLLLLRAQVL